MARDRPRQERPHTLEPALRRPPAEPGDPRAEPADLALRDARAARRRDRVADGAGRDAPDVGFPAAACGPRPRRGGVIRLRADGR